VPSIIILIFGFARESGKGKGGVSSGIIGNSQQAKNSSAGKKENSKRISARETGSRYLFIS
jgi:hypothetical protein